MSFAMSAAIIEPDKDMDARKKQRTQKMREVNPQRVSSVLQSIHNASPDEDGDDQPGDLFGKQINPYEKHHKEGMSNYQPQPMEDYQLDLNRYSNNWQPKTTWQPSPPPQDSSFKPMFDKLNYVIHLLEEQQDQRTNTVAEDVVLYSFLGIFVIFVVDSFTKVGKYVR